MKCEECKYYETADQDKGECRRYAPRPLGAIAVPKGDLTVQKAIWSSVGKASWCGEFEQQREQRW
jgi:hypothetical protein